VLYRLGMRERILFYTVIASPFSNPNLAKWCVRFAANAFMVETSVK